jgi:hypothetical protein
MEGMVNLYQVRKSFWRKRWHIYFVGKAEVTKDQPDKWIASFASERLANEWADARKDRVLMPF